MDTKKIADAFRALAEAFEAEAPAAAPAAEPVKRGRGRPPAAAPAAPAAPAPAQAAEDPFEEPAKPAAPAVTLEEVRKVLTDLKTATSQDVAVEVLKAHAPNLTSLKPEQYGYVVADAKAKLAAAAPKAEEDPFETPAPAAAKVTLEDVRAACVEAGKRTAQDKVQAVVMAHGGSAPAGDGKPAGPSLKALPEAQYAAVIAALANLPKTK